MADPSPREITWRLTVGDDEVHEFSRGDWMNSEAREVKKWVGMNPPQFWVAVGQDDPEALTALVCILRRRNGQPDLKFSDTTFNYGALTFEPVDAPEIEEPDPTQDDPSTSTTPPGTRTRSRGSSSSPAAASAPGS